MQKATLGGGCFWCVEAVFLAVNGVNDVISAYAGGDSPNPSYRDICTGKSGHAEVIQITFNEDIVDFGTLLDIFFTIHNPTTLNRQGADRGTQYRSVIFYHDENQKTIARKSLQDADASDLWPDPIVTELNAMEKFYQAENYHKDYLARVGDRNPYCTFVVKPKVDKFKEEFKDKLKDY